MSLLAFLLACGRAAPPSAFLEPEPVVVRLQSVGLDGTVTLSLTAASPLTLTRAQCAIWQDGVMIDTDEQEPQLRLSQEETRLHLYFEGLESGPVQLTGSLHLSGVLGGQELVMVDLSGAAGEVTP